MAWDMQPRFSPSGEQLAFTTDQGGGDNIWLMDTDGSDQQQVTKEKQFNSEIENKYQTLKIAKTIEGSKENSRNTKLKINALIREIDTCITQLSE